MATACVHPAMLTPELASEVSGLADAILPGPVCCSWLVGLRFFYLVGLCALSQECLDIEYELLALRRSINVIYFLANHG